MKLFFESAAEDRANFERMQIGDSVTVKNYKTGDIYKFVKNSNNNTIFAFTNVLGKNHHASPQQVWGWIVDSFYAKFKPEFEFKDA